MHRQQILLNVKFIETELSHFNPHSQFYVAFSGGLDSQVLLDLCAKSAFHSRITAVYVNHGLQQQADDWQQHCAESSDKLQLKFLALSVDANPKQGESPEEAARNARYQALKSVLAVDDVLLVAQHREDQLETMLLQLFRGAGLSGLSSMGQSAKFGKGYLYRPLLASPKQAIVDYAQQHHLQWLEDPSNQEICFDRNFLRQSIIPQLKQRWSALDVTVSRAAEHCAQAQSFIDDQTPALYQQVFNSSQNALSIEHLLASDNYQQRLVIRYWFQQYALKMPSSQFIARIFTDVVNARIDAQPQLYSQAYFIRRYQGFLFLVKSNPIDLQAVFTNLSPDKPLSLANNGYLHLLTTKGIGISQQYWQNSNVTVAYRQGGERLRLVGREGHHSLKKLYQQAKIPTWQRDKIPLIFLEGQLAAVADLWISADFYQANSQSNYRLLWQKAKDHDEIANVD